MTRTSLAALAIGAAATVAHAQQPSETRSARVAVIDVAGIYAGSLLGKSYAAEIDKLENQIKSEQTKKQTELQKMDTAIRALREDIEKQASVLSAEALDRKRQDLTKKERERQAYVEDGQQELQGMQQRAQAQAESFRQEFQTRVRPHIEAAAKERGVDVIVDSQVAITINKDYDLTKEVIVKADEAEKTKPKPAAGGAAAPKPATPAPAATPTPKP